MAIKKKAATPRSKAKKASTGNKTVARKTIRRPAPSASIVITDKTGKRVMGYWTGASWDDDPKKAAKYGDSQSAMLVAKAMRAPTGYMIGVSGPK